MFRSNFNGPTSSHKNKIEPASCSIPEKEGAAQTAQVLPKMNIWKTLPESKEHLCVLHFECSRASEKVASETGVRLPDEVVGLATEAAYRFCQVLATDIEAFSRHAHRSTITVDDVLLFARRNPHLSAYIKAKAAELKPATGLTDSKTDLPVNKKRRKTKSPTTNSASNAGSVNSTLKFPQKAEASTSSNQPSEVAQKSPLVGDSVIEDVMGEWFEDFDEDQ